MNAEPLGLRVSRAPAPRSTWRVYDISTAETYCSEENAFKLLMNQQDEDNQASGLSIIVASYEHHKDNGDVVENIVGLLKELVNYSEYYLIQKTLLSIQN